MLLESKAFCGQKGGLHDLDNNYDKHSLKRTVQSGEDLSIPESLSFVCVSRLVYKNQCSLDRNASLPPSEFHIIN